MNHTVIDKILNSLVKREFPEIVDFNSYVNEGTTYVDIYLDYKEWFKTHGDGTGPNDWREIDALDDKIISSVKTSLKYVGITDLEVSVFEFEG